MAGEVRSRKRQQDDNSIAVWIVAPLSLSFVILALVIGTVGCGASSATTTVGRTASRERTNAAKESVTLLNVSYDPTRELWRDINSQFIKAYKRDHHVDVDIKQSHGGSATQARAVIDGLDADVVTLAMFQDTDAIREMGLIAEGWVDQLPNKSLPYTSTIVFVVRKGNPKGIKDWPDLVKGDTQIVTPNPKTSGNGKLSLLAAWGSVTQNGGTDEQALQYIIELYKRVPVLDSGARGSTTTFVQKQMGDVHLAWENEAQLEVQEAKGGLEVVYPSISILAEPHVAVVDANVDRKATREVAEAYLKYLYTDDAQNIIAGHFYRPANEEIGKTFVSALPPLRRFPITAVAKDWDDAQRKFFADGAIFDAEIAPVAGERTR
jgi:sulfate transport system substrate-binding protein